MNTAYIRKLLDVQDQLSQMSVVNMKFGVLLEYQIKANEDIIPNIVQILDDNLGVLRCAYCSFDKALYIEGVGWRAVISTYKNSSCENVKVKINKHMAECSDESIRVWAKLCGVKTLSDIGGWVYLCPLLYIDGNIYDIQLKVNDYDELEKSLEIICGEFKNCTLEFQLVNNKIVKPYASVIAYNNDKSGRIDICCYGLDCNTVKRLVDGCDCNNR